MRNFTVLDEDFFIRFLDIFIALTSFTASLIFMVIPGKMGVNYYMCIGEDPQIDSFNFGKVSLKMHRSLHALLQRHPCAAAHEKLID